MRPVKIITDSCSDLSPELMEKYNIDYCKMNTVYNDETSPANLSWTADEVHELYGIMRAGNRVKTTQVPQEEFEKVFGNYISQGFDIVYIGCALKQSGSVNTAAVLAKKLMAENSEIAVYCIDSLNASLGEGMLAIEAAKLAAEGKSASDINSYILSIRKTVLEFVTVHSLDSLRKAGRVSASSAFFGNLMGVKPIIISDADGAQAAFKKVKGRKNSLKEIVSLLAEGIVEPEKQTVFLAHADCDTAEVEEVKNMIKEMIPCKEIYTGYIGPIIGASIGPDAFAVFAFGNEVTYRANN